MAGCLPEELDDAQLANYCSVEADCYTKEDFACWVSACKDHQCVRTSTLPIVDDICSTPKCPTDCHCPHKTPAGPLPGTCSP